MASQLSDFNEVGEKRLIVKLSRTDLVIYYDPSQYTPDVEMQAQKALKSGLGGVYLQKMLSKMLTRWELETKESVSFPERANHRNEGDLIIPPGPVPLTERVLSQVTGIFGMGKIFSSIMSDQRPNEVASEESEDF